MLQSLIFHFYQMTPARKISAALLFLSTFSCDWHQSSFYFIISGLNRDPKRSKALSETLHADPVVDLDLISDECYNILLVRSRDHSAVLRISRAMGCLITFCNLVRSHVGPWTWQSHRRALPNGVWIHIGHKVLTQVILKHPPSGNKNPLECWADAWSMNTKKHRYLGKLSFLLASYFPVFWLYYDWIWMRLDLQSQSPWLRNDSDPPLSWQGL